MIGSDSADQKTTQIDIILSDHPRTTNLSQGFAIRTNVHPTKESYAFHHVGSNTIGQTLVGR